jgi:hypothetical protein
MTTATATKPRTMTSARYPGWEIERVGPDSYLMSRPGGIYAIGVGHTDDHGWEGVLLTRQSGGWKPAKTPYKHCVLGCVREADRREKWIAKYQAKALPKLSK